MSDLVFALELCTDLMSDLLLVVAFLGHLVITDSAPDDFFGLAYDDVLPRGRRFGRFVVAVSHAVRLARIGITARKRA